MTDPTKSSTLGRSFLIGAVVPFAVTAIFAIVGYAMALFGGKADPFGEMIFAAKVGLFLSVIGGLELAIGVFFFEGGRVIDRLMRALGFLTVWGLIIIMGLNFLS